MRETAQPRNLYSFGVAMIKSTDLDNIATSFMQQVLAIKQKASAMERGSVEQGELFVIANDIWAIASRLWPLSAQLRIEEQHDADKLCAGTGATSEAFSS